MELHWIFSISNGRDNHWNTESEDEWRLTGEDKDKVDQFGWESAA